MIPYLVGANQVASASSVTLNPATATGAGDVLAVTAYSTTAAKSCSDTRSNQYILVGAGGGVYRFVTTGKTVGLATTDTITVTLASAGNANMVMIGVSGAAYAPVDQVAKATGTGTAPSVTVTPLFPGEIVISAIGNNTGSATTWGSGFTALGDSHGSLSQALSVAYKVLSATATPSAVTASATITSAAWTAQAVTLITTSFAGSPPVPPTQAAGTVATSSDMNALAQTALFLRRPPMIRATQAGTPQALTGGTATPVNWTALQRDTDGFWTNAAQSRLTVQTQGIYKIRYSIPFPSAGANLSCWVRITTGSNNPQGAGVTSTCWYSWSGSAGVPLGAVVAGGIVPWVMYPGDYAEILANMNNSAGLSNSQQPPTVSMRLVSV